MAKAEQFRAMKSEELIQELDRLRRHHFDLRSQRVTQKLEDTSQLQAARRDVARIFTILRERGEKNIEQRLHSLLAAARKR